MKKVLVTGGAGYIGSFVVRQLKSQGFEPIILDDLSQGHKEAIKNFNFSKINLVSEKDKLNKLFSQHRFAGVIHMAGFIQMGESFKDPVKYFRNNLVSSLNLFEAMVENDVSKIVFSSSAGVYGTPKNLPILEDDPKNPENPYGETKLMIELMLKWFDRAYGLKSISIRYFNAAGAAIDGSMGEDHPDESHIIPLFIKFALEGKKATIFGDDYDTPDGTNVRDYVHVLDLAKAHTLALSALLDGADSNHFNAGVGKGYSNKQIVDEITKVTGKFAVKVGPRRPGDTSSLYASVEKIKKELKWEPEYGLEDIIKSAHLWHKKHPKGYES